MVGLVRNKRKFYLCKKIENSVSFEEPIVKRLNYQPRNSVGEMLSLGEDYSKYLRIKCTPKEAQDFEDKDRCYIYKEPSIPFDPLCNDADYIVDGSPLITLNEAEVNLTRISGD